MDALSLPQAAKKLEKHIITLPAAKQFNKLARPARQAMMDLSDSAYNLRINTERYWGADDSAEQQLFLAAAIEQAGLLDERILAASTHDLIGPADVAVLGALAEDIRERLA